MAAIKKTQRIMTYWLALFIAASFGLFGRAAPSWAAEAKKDYNAKVFSEKMTLYAAQPLVEAGHEPMRTDSYLSKSDVTDTKVARTFVDNTLTEDLNLVIDKRIKDIDRNGITNIEDALLLQNLELNRKIDQLQLQIQLLERKLSE